MDFIIQLPKDISLTEQEIINYWNENESFTKVAVARNSEKKELQYPAITLTAVFVVLGSVGVNIASSVIYDLLKLMIVKKTEVKPGQLTFTEKSNPDNTKSIEVHVSETAQDSSPEQTPPAILSDEKK